MNVARLGCCGQLRVQLLRPRTVCQQRLYFRHHALIAGAVDGTAVIAVRQRHHAHRQRCPGQRFRLPARAVGGHVEPHQLGGAAADIKHQRLAGGAVEQRRAADHREAGFLLR